MIRRLLSLVALCVAPPLALAAPQAPRHFGPVLISDVRLEQDAEAARVSIVVRDGRIEAVLPAGTPPPPGLRKIDGAGALCMPAFVDAFTRAGCDTPVPVVDRDGPFDATANVALGMREANRKGIQPALRAVELLAFEDGVITSYRDQGFAVLHSAPDRELLAGQSAVVTSGAAPLRDRVLRATLAQSGGLRARGEGYPTTLMGSLAQLRQFFMDAGLHERRKAAPELGRRVPYDVDLDAGARLLAGEQRVWARADSRGDIERWLGLAEEFGLQLVIVGGRDAWMIADRLKAAEVPVVLTLDWGDEPKDPEAAADEPEVIDTPPGEAEAPKPEAAQPEVADDAAPKATASDAQNDGQDGQDVVDTPPRDDTTTEEATEDPAPEVVAGEAAAEGETAEEADDANQWIYEEPHALLVERRRLWEERRDGALRLAEAGVPFAFGSYDAKPGELIDRVRALVEAGLDAQLATRALTTDAASLLDEAERLGKVEAGFEAQLALWTDTPWAEGAQLAWLVVDGEPFEFEHDEDAVDATEAKVEATGEWRLEFAENSRADATMNLLMAEDGSVTGTARYQAMRGEAFEIQVTGRVAGEALKLTATTEVEGFTVEITVDATIAGDSMTGKSVWKTAGGTETNAFQGTRRPEDDQ